MFNLFNFVSVETIIYVLLAAVLVLALFLTIKKKVKMLNSIMEQKDYNKNFFEHTFVIKKD